MNVCELKNAEGKRRSAEEKKKSLKGSSLSDSWRCRKRWRDSRWSIMQKL